MASKHARRRKWLWRFVIGVGALVALVLLLAGGLLVYLSTRAGAERARGIALRAANNALAGKIELTRLQYLGDGIRLWGVTLRDPEGEVVAHIDRVEAHLGLPALFSKEIRIRWAEIDHPVLRLRQDARGLNLARAVAARHPSVKTASSSPSTLHVRLERLTLGGGDVRFVDAGQGEPREAHLVGLLLQAAGEYRGGDPGRIQAQLTTTAWQRLPLPGPTLVELRAGGDLEHLAAWAALRLGGASLTASAATHGETLDAFVRELEVAPWAARRVVPSYPLRVAATLEAALHKQGSQMDVSAGFRGTQSRLALHARGDFAEKVVEALTLRARDVDLGEIRENAPPTRIALDLSGKGRGTRLETLEAELDLKVPETSIRGETIGPLAVKVRAQRGTFSVADLLLRLPGLEVTGDGEGRVDQFHFGAKLRASDLKQLAKAFTGVVETPPLPLAGRGALDVDVRGPLRAPAVLARGRFPFVGFGENRIRELALNVDVPSVSRPLDADVAIQLGEVLVNQRHLEQVRLLFSSDGPRLRAHVDSRGHIPFSFAFAGIADPDALGMTLTQLRLELAAPPDAWTLEHPTRLRIGSEPKVEPLAVRSGVQRVELAGRKSGDSIEAHVQVDHFALGRLPSWMLPPSSHLKGELNLSAKVQGRLPQPQVEARLDARGVQFRQLRDLNVHFDGRYRDDRARGTLSAEMRGPRLNAEVDVPVQGLLHARHEPLNVRIDVPEQRLEDLTCPRGLAPAEQEKRLCLVMTPRPLRGHGGLQLTLRGFGDAPLLQLGAHADAVTLGTSSPASFTLTVSNTQPSGHLLAQWDATHLTGESHARIAVARSLPELIAGRPETRDPNKVPVEVNATVQGVQLGEVARTGLAPETMKGTLAASAQLRGTLAAPLGSVEAHLKSFMSTSVRLALDADVALRADPSQLLATVDARQQSASILALKARLGAGPGALRDMDAVRRAAVHVDAELGPVQLQDLPLVLNDTDSVIPSDSTPQGLVRVSLKVDGTPDAPLAELQADLTRLGTKASPALGEVHAHYRYAQGDHTLDARLASPGGTMSVTGSTTCVVSASSLAHGLSFSRAPLRAQLAAKGFDPSFLTGVTPLLRRIGGAIDAEATLDGTLGAPTGLGQLAWRNGAVSIAGFGEYTGIQLEVSATDQRLQLKQLLAKSGQGSLELKAQAERTGAEFRLQGDAHLDHFPIVSDDQVLATVTSRMSLQGTVSPTLVNVDKLSIPDATVELPDIKRKDLQPLQRPGDILLVRNGIPVNGIRQAHPKDPGIGGSGPTAAAAPVQRRYQVTLDAPQNLWIKGADLNVEVGFSDHFKLEVADAPAIFGKVRVLRGRVDVLGRRFDVQSDSTAQFTGPPIHPQLNVTAEHFNQRENVKVFLKVTGRAPRIAIKTSSEPPLPESEIYTLIATGRRTLRPGSGATTSSADQAVSMLGSLVVGQLKQTLQKKIPLDVLSIQAGDSGYGLNGARLEAGTYVMDKLYLGYQGQLGADTLHGQNANAARVEYQFAPHWSLEAEYGDAMVGGADMVWSRDY